MADGFFLERVIHTVEKINGVADLMGTSGMLLDDEIVWLQASKEIIKRLREQLKASSDFCDLSLSDQSNAMATVNGVLITLVLKISRHEKIILKKNKCEELPEKQYPVIKVTVKQPEEKAVNKIVPPTCYLCNNRHFLYYCREFLKMRTGNRLAFIRDHRLCENCFNFRHPTSKCPKPPRCLYCKVKHHSELHAAFVRHR